MSVITKDTIQPSSGQALTIKDEGGTASITVATNGEATFAENVILTANKGLSFQNHSVTSVTGASSTTSNNILDDYEEGTWTISIVAQNGFGSTLNTDGTPRYVKIGDQVTVMCGFYAEGQTSAVAKGDYVEIEGFPFAMSTDTKKSASWSVSFNYNTANSALFRAVPTGGGGLFCLVTSLYGSSGALNGGRIQITGTYFV